MTDNREEGLEKRMNQLEAELAEKREAENKRVGPSDESQRGYRNAVKISSEFIAAVIVGALLGYLFDWLAGTKPWGMVFFLLLGFVAGVMNVLRTVGVVKSPHPVDRLGAMNNEKKEK